MCSEGKAILVLFGFILLLQWCNQNHILEMCSKVNELIVLSFKLSSFCIL